VLGDAATDPQLAPLVHGAGCPRDASSLKPGVFLPQPSAGLLQHLERQRRLLLQQAPEVPVGNRDGVNVGLGDDTGGARPPIEQRDLSEEGAGAELAAGAPVI